MNLPTPEELAREIGPLTYAENAIRADREAIAKCVEEMADWDKAEAVSDWPAGYCQGLSAVLRLLRPESPAAEKGD